jgi:uncharacterized protein (TIGR00297 family)
MERSEKGSLGTVYYPVSLLILVFITFWLDVTYVGAAGILILGYGDGLAGLIGKKFGKKKLLGNKTIIGTSTIFITSLMVALVIFSIYTPNILIPGSILIALFAAIIELITPKDYDNLTVPLGVSMLYYLIIPVSSEILTIWLVAILINLLVAVVAYQRKSLDISGTVAAIVIGVLIYALAGPLVWLALMTFFVSSSSITHFKKNKKQALSEEYKKTRRNYRQVLANGLMAAIFSCLYAATGQQAMIIVAIVAIAASCADTWGSELGVLNKGKTVSIISMKPVAKGQSGGISLFGTAMSFAGSALIASVYSIGLLIQSDYTAQQTLLIFAIISIIGLLGSLMDSLLGATIQAQYLDNNTKLPTESHTTQSKPNQKIKGLKIMNNDAVNLTANIISAFVAVIVFYGDIISLPIH